MPDIATKPPARTELNKPDLPAAHPWRPFEALRREIDRLFQSTDPWSASARHPMFSGEHGWSRFLANTESPAIDIVENDKAYELTAELPGMDEKDIDVKVVNGFLRIRGEKQDGREETTKDFYVRERQFGSFERCFALPDSVDSQKIDADFAKGVLTVLMPKRADSLKSEKKIEIKVS